MLECYCQQLGDICFTLNPRFLILIPENTHFAYVSYLQCQNSNL